MWIGTSVGMQHTAPENSRRFLAQQKLFGKLFGAVGTIPPAEAIWGVSKEELTIYEYGRESAVSPPPFIYITGLRVNGKERAVTFALLQSGAYTFEVSAITADGVESARPASLRFEILPPFWQRWWFIALCAVSIGSVLYAIHAVRLDRLLEIEKIRSRIATDLHDDIGAGLTHIGLLSQVALQKKNAPPREENAGVAARDLGNSMERVGNIARELSAAMSDVVWSVNPQHDSMAALQRRLRTFAGEICEAKGIAPNFEVAESIAAVKLHPEIRRNLLLIAKEALHNAVKYSGSASIFVKLALTHKNILLDISDAGNGFELAQAKSGNGLANMRFRAEKLGGKFEIVSECGKGTHIKAVVPLRN
jgi:signal transduction histidine kinase